MGPPHVLTEEDKREIGQHFITGFHGFAASENIKTLIGRYYLGNVILMRRNVKSALQMRRLVQELQKCAKEARVGQLLVGIDQENGLVSAFSGPDAGNTYPGAMALAATGSPALAEKVARASARELKMVGVNWVFGPVADVNSDSRNPVIGVRSFGDDPHKVATFALATHRGTHASGVAATAKHFPGHGDTHVDSHLALPRIGKRRGEIGREELVPFRALVKGVGDADAGGNGVGDASTKGNGVPVPSVMTGHMALPLVVVGDEVNEEDREDPDTPSSLSRVITKGILRDEMGYDGVVVTDCLEMDAVLDGLGVVEGSIKALEAGADVVMICHTFERHVEAIEGVYAGVESGRIGMEGLRRSGARVRKMKGVYAREVEEGGEESEEEWEKRWREVREEGARLSAEVYPLSTTVVWDARVLPVSKVHGVVVVTPRVEAVNRAVDPGDGTLVDKNGVKNTAGAAYVALANAVRVRVPEAKHVVYTESGVDREEFDGAGTVIWVMRNADLKPWQVGVLESVQARLRERGVRVVLVASCGPYDLVGRREAYGGWTAYLATYEFTVPALETLAAVVFGEVQGVGKMPVVA